MGAFQPAKPLPVQDGLKGGAVAPNFGILTLLDLALLGLAPLIQHSKNSRRWT